MLYAQLIVNSPRPANVQKYDLDPAAKAAAASVLASKLGEETGLKVHVGEEPKLDSAVARSNDVEISPSEGLRNRKQSNARGSRTGGTTAAQNPAQGAESSLTSSSGLEQPPMVVEHFQGSGASDGGWIAKIAALLVGEDPSQSYALICGNCHMHNGVYDKQNYLISFACCVKKDCCITWYINVQAWPGKKITRTLPTTAPIVMRRTHQSNLWGNILAPIQDGRHQLLLLMEYLLAVQ